MAGEREQLHFTIERLSEKHDETAFSCGVETLDSYLRKLAGQDARRHAAVCFVATPDGQAIAGYYTLSQFAVQLDTVPDALIRKLPRYPLVPATLLGRLAAASNFRGQRIGEMLLMDALHRSLQLSRQVASTGVVVDAKDDSAVSFYRKYGFLELPQAGRRLFLPMMTIARLFR